MDILELWNLYMAKHSFKELLLQATLKIVLIIVIFILSIIIVRAGRYVIKKLIEKQKNFKYLGNGKRLDTMGTILSSILRYGVYFVATVTILTNVLKVFDIKTILTAAGIGGIALGFGAQSLVKDVISGFFILAENQFAVGDVVTIENMTGTIEEMELRITKIRNYNGELYSIPNGEIKKVTNHTRGNRLAIVETKIPYDVEIEKAIMIIEKACKQLELDSKVLLEPPEVLGVTEFGETYYVVRAVARTIGAEHWVSERELRKKIVMCFEEEKIKLGTPIVAGIRN